MRWRLPQIVVPLLIFSDSAIQAGCAHAYPHNATYRFEYETPRRPNVQRSRTAIAVWSRDSGLQLRVTTEEAREWENRNSCFRPRPGLILPSCPILTMWLVGGEKYQANRRKTPCGTPPPGNNSPFISFSPPWFDPLLPTVY